MTVRALELFCGIGGFAAAVAAHDIRIMTAIDQSEAALAVYRHNFPDHPCRNADLERLNSHQLGLYQADLWWLSPPCQPYSVRGRQQDLADPRARSLVRLLDILAELPANRLPSYLALENVAGFATSQARLKLLATLGERGYEVREEQLCPTEMGIPSRRPRYYLTASRRGLNQSTLAVKEHCKPLASYLDPTPAIDQPELLVDNQLLERFGNGLRILDPTDPAAYTTCFAGSYGKTLVHAGSYLRHGEGVRHFTPPEIARLLGFPADFTFPPQLTLRQQWHLIGNSLSIFAVRRVLQGIPGI